MVKHWLGIAILATWTWSAISAICGWWGAAWHLTEIWIVLVVLWVLRGFYRLGRRLFGGSVRA